MTITAKIIADSISPENIRLTTMLLRYPRFIHAEFMTHRVFSRNASSSRAIPVQRLIGDIIADTAMPISWGANKPGMQAGEEHYAEVGLPFIATDQQGVSIVRNEAYDRKEAWIEARNKAIEVATAFHIAGYHKQIVNRLLEPFSHINVVVSATEWSNFIALRLHPDAQPEIHELAQQIWNARANSVVKSLQPGEWHVPFVDPAEQAHWLHNSDRDERRGLDAWDVMVRLSIARCARTSYLTHEGKVPDVEKDLELYERLVGAVPLHASPAEHQATPDTVRNGDLSPEVRKRWARPLEYDYPNLHGNLVGWIQKRKLLPGENQ